MCSLNTGIQGACYDNVWADMELNGGSPDVGDIYAYIDLFTWKGWFYSMSFYVFNNAA